MTMESNNIELKTQRNVFYLIDNNIPYNEMNNEEIKSIINYKVEQKVKEIDFSIRNKVFTEECEKQANFMINLAKKSRNDMLKLIKESNERTRNLCLEKEKEIKEN